MADSHPQAYLSAFEVIAASPSLDVASLHIPDAGGDALLVVESNGHGLLAARTEGDFTHVVGGLAAPGIELWEAPHWRADGEHLEEIEALEPGPLDLRRALDLLADAPPGVHAELLDAALAGPIVLVEDDPERRAAWIAWLAATVPGPLTFATFTTRPLDVRVSATTHEHAAAFSNAIDTSRPSIMAPSRYALVATTLAARNPAALVAPADADAVALAVAGGATDQLTPDDLPRALELITDLARTGDVATAARAAAALGSRPVISTDLAVSAPTPTEIEVLAEPEPEEVIEDAEVVSEEFFETTTTLDAFASALTAWAPREIPEAEVIEETFDEGMALTELEAEVEHRPGDDDAPAHAEGRQSLEALMAAEPEIVTPVFVEPELSEDSGRSLGELMAAFTGDPLEAPPEEEPVIEETFEGGVSLHDLEASLEIVEEAEVGMSLDEFEASLKREHEQ